MAWQPILKKLIAPLVSREVRGALALLIAAYAIELGWGANEETISTAIGVIVALALGVLTNYQQSDKK